jgi:multiple sugar transport system permease protein
MAALPVTLSSAFVAFGLASAYIFLLRQFFLGLPRELFEAARVDGADRPAPDHAWH